MFEYHNTKSRIIDSLPTHREGQRGAAVALPIPAVEKIDQVFIHTWVHDLSPKTRDTYIKSMRKFYLAVGKPLREVTLPDIHDFMDTLVEEGLAPTTQRCIVLSLKSAFSFGQKIGYLPANLGLLFKTPKVEDRLAERIMSQSDVVRIIALETDQRNHAILVTLYRGGLRASELVNLQWRHVQERDETGQLAIFGKGKRTRHVLLNREAWEEIQNLKPDDPQPDGYVFASRNKLSRLGKDKGWQLSASRLHDIIENAAIKAGVELYRDRRGKIHSRVSAHWFRHAHASHALDNGAPPHLVQATLGHSSLAVTSRYTHVRPDTSSATWLKA